ncbi:hypothetical protein ALC62_01813 [Cyphomyrmex costatus]|uniref:Uncharacterized protein n=2 Tax=Cyphomyrmex costatus TaxID=456900 RepID=A0A151IP91_9HYME|nr:hypothetical protein ALC62_01813 [Cyphomyrmex costatus]
MPLATSDFRNPVCQEMRSLRFNSGNGIGGPEHFNSSLMESKISPIQPLETLSFASICNEQEYHYAKAYNEQGSVDSSDTYASCQTHPSHSQGDLTEDADSNLYINPLEATEKFKTSQMKKSISGEVGRNIIAETLPSAGSLKEASKINLNDMMPKHRKIRIQQSIKPRTQFVSDQESIVMRSILKEDTAMEDNNNHYGGLRGGKPSPLVSTNSLASATRIINYHMFRSLGASKQYKEATVENKLSLSADSIDSGGMPFIDQHRTSKSILKKSDSGNNYYSNAGDSDTEKLITDSMSTASICDNETSSCDASANVNNVCTKRRPISPLFSRQVLESIFLTNNNFERECASDKGDKKLSIARKSRILFSDIEEEKHARDEAVAENQNKELDDQSCKSKIRVQEQSKETMLILRPYKTKKTEEKRKTNKLSGHSSSITKRSDANYFPPKYNFSS